jgi:hypothetical protein
MGDADPRIGGGDRHYCHCLISAFTFAAWSAGHIPNRQPLMNCERAVRPFAGRHQKYGKQDDFLIFLAFQLCILDTYLAPLYTYYERRVFFFFALPR